MGSLNQGALIMCSYFNDSANYDANTDISALVGAGPDSTSANELTGPGDLPDHASADFIAYLTDNIGTATSVDQYVCNAVFSGLATAFGSSASEAASAAGVCDLSNYDTAVSSIYA